MNDDGLRRTMVLAFRQETRSRTGRIAPVRPAIVRPAEDQVAVMLIGSDQIQSVAVIKQCGPELTVDGSDGPPGCTPVYRAENAGDRARCSVDLGPNSSCVAT